MKKITTIEELKNEAFCLDKPILVRWAQHQEEEILKPELDKSLEHCYAINNSVIAFVCDKALYVIPYMLRVVRILETNGFTTANMDVPFSHGDYPLFEKARWFLLQQSALKQSFIDFEESCINHCNEHNIGSLDDALMKKCFEIPRDGINVKLPLFEDIYFPVLIAPFFDTFAIHMLGLYSINNGVCVFIYRNGRTFVTRSHEVIEALPKAGYLETSMFVPLSKNETIIDPEFANLWKEISSES